MLSGMFGSGQPWSDLAWIDPAPAACDTQQAQPAIKL